MFFSFLYFYIFTQALIRCSEISFFEKSIFFYKSVIRLWLGCIKEWVRDLIGWATKKWEAIFVGVIIAILMSSLLLVQDISRTSQGVKHFNEKLQLTRVIDAQSAQLKQVTEFADFLSEINQSLRREASKNQSTLEEAALIINNQRVILESLVEYLKKIGEWPPKIDPPRPIDPDTTAGTRSEA